MPSPAFSRDDSPSITRQPSLEDSHLMTITLGEPYPHSELIERAVFQCWQSFARPDYWR